MKKIMWMVLAALLAVTAGVTLIALPRGEAWTTSSPAALHEFENALEAQKKLYHREARDHLKRALELDPNFVIAKLYTFDVKGFEDQEQADRVRQEILSADVSQLSERERFMIERFRLVTEKRYEDAEALVDEYLQEHPDDPWGLYTKAMGAWSRMETENAERLFRQLLEVSPNWVIAYNQLGYITMLQGRFTEAEEYFTSYRFIAPDQANPHDSLGELFIILGRYEEARQSLENALRIKPDFWASYEHLLLANALLSDWEGMRRVLDDLRAQDQAPGDVVSSLECLARLIELQDAGAWREILEAYESELCGAAELAPGATSFYAHRAACRLGDWDAAARIEDEIDAKLSSMKKKSSMVEAGVLAHATGVRAALQGDLDLALEELSDLDRELTYINSGTGMLKLYNRLMMVETLRALGHDAEAHKLLGKVRAVNPQVAAEFEGNGLSLLGL